MKYYAPYGVSDPNAPYINGDPTIGREGSIPPAQSIEHDMREIVAVIEHSAIEPQEADLTQLLQAVRSQRLNYAVDTGTADAVIVNFNPPIGDTVTPGMPLRIKAAANNVGPVTLSVDGVVNPLRQSSGIELAADDKVGGAIFEAIWNDNGYWEFNNYLGSGVSTGDTNTFITKIPYAVDVGTVNALVANFTPPITALVPGDAIEVKLANNITGPATIVVNGMTARSIVRPNGAPLVNGDGAVGQIMFLIYSDAGNFQFFGILPSATGMYMPIGCIILALAGTAPLGTLKLNGALLQRTEHPLLWAYANASGRIVDEVVWQNAGSRSWTAFSRGDGTTTFRLPDFRGEFMRFWDDGRGVDAGRVLGTQQDSIVGTLTMSGVITLLNPKLSMDPPTVTEWADAAYGTPGAGQEYERVHYVEGAELAWYSHRLMWSGLTGSGGQVSYNEPYNMNHDPDHESGPVEGAQAIQHVVSWVSPQRVGTTTGTPPFPYSVNWPGYANGVAYTYKHRGARIVSDISISGSGGGNETRPRNAAVIACIVDG